ncbi:MAG: HEAT repeat domain-containing protein [Methanolinea sp.]|nr:HEAT repeat domain-containing protein [Methanolinea sp.]
MIPGWLYSLTIPDIPGLRERKDYEGLTRALRHRDLKVQWNAARALGEIGKDSVAYLIRMLENTRNREARLGIIEELGMIRDARAISPLIAQLEDRSNEIRWETALALGEIGDPAAVPALRKALEDKDKYVRYGAALSLRKLSWVPGSESESAFLRVGMQEWEEIAGMGPGAIDALGNALADYDKNVRIDAVRTMGILQHKEAIPVLYRAISDPDEEVHWEAVQAASSCGLPMRYLPRALARRPRSGKNPLVAGLLNFMLPGIGYMYLGFWWGILLFQIEFYVIAWVLNSMSIDDLNIEHIFSYFLILVLIYLFLATHAWYMAKRMPDL